MVESLESELTILRDDLDRYEALKAGKVKKRRVHSLRELPVLLIEGRITAGLTQRQLAQRLGLPEQQIQRYEATMYSGVSLDRLQDCGRTRARDRGTRHLRGARVARAAYTRPVPTKPLADLDVALAEDAAYLLDAIARSDRSRASVVNEVRATGMADGILGRVEFDANGDPRRAPISVFRVDGNAPRRGLPALGGTVLDRVLGRS